MGRDSLAVLVQTSTIHREIPEESEGSSGAQAPSSLRLSTHFSPQEQVEELEDRLKELKNGVQLQQRKNQELEGLRTSLHRELSIYKCVWVPSLWGRGAGRRRGMGGMSPRWGHTAVGQHSRNSSPFAQQQRGICWKLLQRSGVASQEAGVAI